MQQLIRQCKEKLCSLGFDLFVPFSGISHRLSVLCIVQHYNSLVQKRFQITDYGRENTLAVLIGIFFHNSLIFREHSWFMDSIYQTFV